MSVTAVIPTIPSRKERLGQAVQSVLNQTFPVDSLIIECDVHRQGAAATRNSGLQKATTEFVAFLDDDDQWKPNHLEILLEAQRQHDADYVFSWFDVVNGTDPFPENFGKTFDNNNPHPTTVVTLVRTELAQKVGMRQPDPGPLDELHAYRAGEDWQFTLDCISHHAKIIHVPERTWLWTHHEKNSSGVPGQGDAPQ